MSFEKRKAIQKAIGLTQQGRLDKAIAEYETILGTDPSDSSLYNTLGDLYAQTGSTSNALACYLKLVDALKAEGRVTRAIAVYKKIIKLDPNNHGAMAACADLYAEEGLQAEAKHLHLLAAEKALERGADAQAIDACERLLRLEPRDPSVVSNLASLLVRKGRRSEAVNLLGRLAQGLRSHGRADDAGLLDQRMAEIAPGAPTDLDLEGRLTEGRTVSIATADELGGICLDEAGALRAFSPASSSDRHLADSIVRDCDETSTETQQTHYQLGMAYREMGLLDDAIDEFRRAAADERLAAHACNMVGFCLLLKGEAEGAIHELRRGLSIAGRPAEEFRSIKYNLATAYQSTGDHETALAILSDLHEEDPSFREVKSRVMELQMRIGRGSESGEASEGNVKAKRRARPE